MTKANLINELAITTGLDKKTITLVVENFMKNVKNHVANGEGVYLRGFGSFLTKKRAAKIARNISKNTSVHVPEHRIPYFKPSPEFSNMVK